MALADTLTKRPPQTPRPTKLTRILNTVQGKDKAALEAALANPSWTATDIARELRAEGYDVGEHTIRRYRREAGL